MGAVEDLHLLVAELDVGVVVLGLGHARHRGHEVRAGQVAGELEFALQGLRWRDKEGAYEIDRTKLRRL